VRKFPGHDAEVTDLTFSADSRWLVTASLDSTCRSVRKMCMYIRMHIFLVGTTCFSFDQSPPPQKKRILNRDPDFDPAGGWSLPA
jgi:U3 small nucleolar RNA-associated protein 21